MKKVTKIWQTITKVLICIYLLILPWQAVWIMEEVYMSGAKWEFGTLALYISELFLFLTAISFLIWYLLKRRESRVTKFKLGSDRQWLMSVLVLLIYCFVSFIWADDKYLAAQWSRYFSEMFLLVVMIGLGPVSFRQVWRFFLLGMLLPTIFGILQFIFLYSPAIKALGLAQHSAGELGQSVVEGEGLRYLRSYGSFSHPNIFAGYLVVTFFGYLTVIRRKLLSILGLLLTSAALFFTFSRAGWLGLLFVVIIFSIGLVLRNRTIIKDYIVRLIPVVLLLAVLTALYYPLVFTRLEVSSRLERISIDERLTQINLAQDLYFNNPILGVGVGNYTRSLYNSVPGKPGWFYVPVHNGYFLLTVELGLVGVLLYFVCFILYLKLVSKNLFFRDSVYLLVLVFVSLAFDHYIYSGYSGLVLLGLIFGLILLETRENKQLTHS